MTHTNNNNSSKVPEKVRTLIELGFKAASKKEIDYFINLLATDPDPLFDSESYWEDLFGNTVGINRTRKWYISKVPEKVRTLIELGFKAASKKEIDYFINLLATDPAPLFDSESYWEDLFGNTPNIAEDIYLSPEDQASIEDEAWEDAAAAMTDKYQPYGYTAEQTASYISADETEIYIYLCVDRGGYGTSEQDAFAYVRQWLRLGGRYGTSEQDVHIATLSNLPILE